MLQKLLLFCQNCDGLFNAFSLIILSGFTNASLENQEKAQENANLVRQWL
jgi:hypothetical protein